MGLFDRPKIQKAAILYTDEHGIQHHLTAEQYGEKCVEWAVGLGRLKSQNLAAFGKVRNQPDLIAKISQEPFIAATHGTAYFVAVYCTYPVIRFGISNELFKGIISGIQNAILNGSYFSSNQHTSTEYLNQLVTAVSQYTAILLESAGMANLPNQDRMLFGISGACQQLLVALNHEYAGVAVPIGTITQSKDNIDDVQNLESVFTVSKSTVISPIAEDEIVAWFDANSRALLLAALADRLGIGETGSPADFLRLEQIADQQRDGLKTILSSEEPIIIEERVKNALNWALEVTDCGDSMTMRLKEKLSSISCSMPKPVPKVVLHSPLIEATRSVDSKNLVLSIFTNAATQFVNGADARKTLVLF